MSVPAGFLYLPACFVGSKIKAWNFDTYNFKNYKIYLTEIATKNNNDHYAPNVANSYASGINSSSRIYGKNLWEITSSEDLRKIYEDLEKNEDFTVQNSKSNATYSNALKRYMEYLQYKESINNNSAQD